MNAEAIAASCRYNLHKVDHVLIAVHVIDADTMLDTHRQWRGGHHRSHTVGHKFGLCHQAGPKVAALNAIAWTANIQINFAVAKVVGYAGAICQQLRIIATNL